MKIYKLKIFLIIFLSIALPSCKERNNQKVNNEIGVIPIGGHEWSIHVLPGGLNGNHECISLCLKDTLKLQSERSCYQFFTDEIYYKIDSLKKIYIYAPYSSIKKPKITDNNIVIHELYDYDSVNIYRKEYHKMGLRRITTSDHVR